MFSARDKANCAKREAGFRKRVYPRFVAEGKMSGKVADEQIAMMEEIAVDYGALAERAEAAERLI